MLALRNKTPLHRLPVIRVLYLQMAMTALVALSSALLQGIVAGYSALCGGLLALLPNMYFAFKAFRYFGARSSQAIVQSIWAGEMGKLILTAVLFALVFMGVEQLDVAALFVAYLLVLAVSAAALLMVKSFPKH